jgi:hypothetical protein
MEMGIAYYPGISSLSDNGLSFPQNNADRNYALSTAGSGSAGPQARQKRSDVKPGFAFQAALMYKDNYQPGSAFLWRCNMVITVIFFTLETGEIRLQAPFDFLLFLIVMPTRFTMQVVTRSNTPIVIILLNCHLVFNGN